MENLRSQLYRSIDKHGLTYEKLIKTDAELHIEINRSMREQLGRKL